MTAILARKAPTAHHHPEGVEPRRPSLGGSEMYRSIVVGTDCTDTASVAVEHAAQLACAVGACLHVVSVYQEPATVAIAQTGYVAPQSDEWSDMAIKDRQRQVDSITTRLRTRGLNVTGHVTRGDPRARSSPWPTRLTPT